jgi:hypothetical protein
MNKPTMSLTVCLFTWTMTFELLLLGIKSEMMDLLAK